jgi:hypothetical protein
MEISEVTTRRICWVNSVQSYNVHQRLGRGITSSWAFLFWGSIPLSQFALNVHPDNSLCTQGPVPSLPGPVSIWFHVPPRNAPHLCDTWAGISDGRTPHPLMIVSAAQPCDWYLSTALTNSSLPNPTLSIFYGEAQVVHVVPANWILSSNIVL